MKKDIILTFMTEFFVLVCGLLVYKLVAQGLGKEPFFEYALIRRTVSLIQPALLLGLGVGIPRYMSFSHKTEGGETPDFLFAAGLAVLLPTTLAFNIILLLFKKFFAYLFLGSSAYAFFIFPMSLMLFGQVLHASVYSYYRGYLLMGKANLLQLINLALVPVPMILLWKDLKQILFLTGAAWVVVSLVFLAPILRKLSFKRSSLLPCMKRLLTYGLQRVPGDFGLSALLSLPATFTTHLSGIQKAGAVAFGVSLLNMAGSAFAPIGLILLPKASRLIAEKNLSDLKYYARRILAITFVLTAAAVFIFELFAGRIIELYLGQSYTDLLTVTRIIMTGSLAYTIYVSLRSIIDAYYVRAVNTLNIFIALILFCSLSLLAVFQFKNDLLIVLGFVLALFLLGLLTLRETLRILKKQESMACS